MALPKVCIFCEKRPLTREHIWSKWTRDLIGKSTSSGHLNIITHAATNTSGARRTNGGLDTAKLKVVCGNCNNGWMSRLDEAVKDYASALITGEPACLDAGTQEIVARWLIMKMMVTEFSKDMPVVSFQIDRTQVMNGLWPESHDWIVGLANQSAASQRTRSFVRHYVPMMKSVKIASKGFNPPKACLCP